MRVLGFYFDLVFGFLFFRRRRRDDKETKGDADATRCMNETFSLKHNRWAFVEQAVFADITVKFIPFSRKNVRKNESQFFDGGF